MKRQLLILLIGSMLSTTLFTASAQPTKAAQNGISFSQTAETFRFDSPPVSTTIPFFATISKNEIKTPTVIQESLNSESGDFYDQPVIRYFKPYWYMLRGQTMSVFDSKKEIKTYEIPVTLSRSIYLYKGGETRTAWDYLFADGFWYVADTYGNRIMQFDQNFQQIKSVPVEMPYQLRMTKDKQLEVKQIKGTTQFDRSLSETNSQSLSAFSTKSIKKSKQELDRERVFIDPYTKMQWIYRDSDVTVYDAKQQLAWQFPSWHIEHAGANLREPNWVMFGYEMLLILDHRIERFQRSGKIKWIGSIEFPRETKENMYFHHDGSFVLLKDAGLLYLQQDAQLIEIDLRSSSVSNRYKIPIEFEDRMSVLRFAKNGIWFTVNRTADTTDVKEAHWLYRFDPKTKTLARTKLSKYAELYQIRDLQKSPSLWFKAQRDDQGKLIKSDLNAAEKLLVEVK